MTEKETLIMELELKLANAFGRIESIDFRTVGLPQLNMEALTALKNMLTAEEPAPAEKPAKTTFKLKHRQAGKKIENQLWQINPDGTESILDTCKGKARHQVVVKQCNFDKIAEDYERQRKEIADFRNRDTSWTEEAIAKRENEYIALRDEAQRKFDAGAVEFVSSTWSFKAGTKTDLREWDNRYDLYDIVTLED
jgi:hypothetical protein